MTRNGFFFGGVALLLVAVFATGFWGRNAIQTTVRTGCVRGGQNLADDVNVLRAEAHGNYLVSTDPKQSHRTRLARGQELTADLHSIQTKDSRIDGSLTAYLNYAVDRYVVAHGQYLVRPANGTRRFYPAFSCYGAYPPASLIP